MPFSAKLLHASTVPLTAAAAGLGLHKTSTYASSTRSIQLLPAASTHSKTENYPPLLTEQQHLPVTLWYPLHSLHVSCCSLKHCSRSMSCTASNMPYMQVLCNTLPSWKETKSQISVLWQSSLKLDDATHRSYLLISWKWSVTICWSLLQSYFKENFFQLSLFLPLKFSTNNVCGSYYKLDC